jgi:hypothetical protein
MLCSSEQSSGVSFASGKKKTKTLRTAIYEESIFHAASHERSMALRKAGAALEFHLHIVWQVAKHSSFFRLRQAKLEDDKEGAKLEEVFGLEGKKK